MTSISKAQPHPVETPLRLNRDFVMLTAGQTLSQLGGAVAAFALPLIALEMTGSPGAAGLVGALETGGRVTLALVAGSVVDSVSRRTVLVAASAVRVALWLALGWGVARGTDGLCAVWAVAMVSGIGGMFFGAAESAALKVIVPPRQFPRAVAVNDARSSVASLVGPPLGGLLLGVAPALPVLVNAVTFVCILVGVLAIRTPLARPAGVRRGGTAAGLASGARHGVGFVYRQVALRNILAFAGGLNFTLNALVFVFVIYLRQRGIQPSLIGLLEVGAGLGGLVGAMVAPRALDHLRLGRSAVTLAWVVAAASVCMLLARDSLAVLVGITALMFLVIPTINTGLMSYVAIVTPSEMQGRVESVGAVLSMGLMPLATVFGGLGIEHLGAVETMAAVGAISVGLAGLLTASREVRSMPAIAEVRALS